MYKIRATSVRMRMREMYVRSIKAKLRRSHSARKKKTGIHKVKNNCLKSMGLIALLVVLALTVCGSLIVQLHCK